MSDGSCARFNNATQRVYGGTFTPIVYVWETNDPTNPWCAEARLLENGAVSVRFPQSSAPKKKIAKDLAANTAYQALCAHFPNIDLSDV